MQAMRQQRSPGAERAVKRAADRKAERKAKGNSLAAAPVAGGLLRLSRDVEHRELRTVEFASNAPTITEYERWQALNAARGDRPDRDSIQGSDAQALLAFDDETISATERSERLEPLNHAGLRAHLASAAEYGPTVTRVVRVERERLVVAGVVFSLPDTLDLVVTGKLSAVQRRFPDELTRNAWAAAGVVFGRSEKLKQMELY